MSFETNRKFNAESAKTFAGSQKKSARFFAILWLYSVIFALPVFSQTATEDFPPQSLSSVVETPDKLGAVRDARKYNFSREVRVEKTPVGNVGAEIVTIFVNLKDTKGEQKEVPLFSVLRDTLGDNVSENDRLRYVWLLSYVKPSLAQRIASFLPFLYTRTTNKKDVGKGMPPPVADLSPMKKEIWNEIFWRAFRHLVISDMSLTVRASILHNRQNEKNYQQSAIERALAVVALYESIEGEKLLSERELKDIQSKLWMKEKLFGSLMQSENLDRAYHKNTEKIRDIRGHNWELLRQYAEAQNLYFEPLEMPDGSATHALVWIAQEDLQENKGRKFEGRFLNFKNPWRDSRLQNWKGYTQTRWYGENNEEVSADTPNARRKTLIPLALYGLDYPKIPIILVDFRDRYNPKKREMSRRVLDDLARNVLSLSRLGGLPYFFGRYVYDFITSRRGIDANQASRFRSYSQLKLLLSLSNSLDSELNADIAERLETVSLNPLENDLDVEINVAQKQYQNLLTAAGDSGKLAQMIENDRREEMSQVKHNRRARIFQTLAHFLTFRLYTHREKPTPELIAKMDARRQMDFHERFLREVADKSAQPDIDQNIDKIKRSMEFVRANKDTSPVGSKTVKAFAKIFTIAEDVETRQLASVILKGINSPTAKKQMLNIYQNAKIQSEWRNLFAGHLNLPLLPPTESPTAKTIEGN